MKQAKCKGCGCIANYDATTEKVIKADKRYDGHTCWCGSLRIVKK